MTRDEAIRRLKTLRNYCRSIIRDEYEGSIWKQNIEALDLAIEAGQVQLEEVFLPYLTDNSGRTLFDVYRSGQLALDTSREGENDG